MPRGDINWEDGVIYLIHFNTKFGHAQHYLGYAHDFNARMERHRKGRGSRLIKHIQEAGIEWQVVRQWKPASPQVEAELKKWHNNRRLCPLCEKQMAFDRAEHMRSQRKKAKEQTQAPVQRMKDAG
jgi:predicted GIY-YIG superfamily endonuclease